MLKYIKMTASSTFGNVFSVLVATAFLPLLPMLPMQLLVQNLLYDISQIGIPFDNVDWELLCQPQRWQPGDIGRFMVFFGAVSSFFDLTTYGGSSSAPRRRRNRPYFSRAGSWWDCSPRR